MLRTLLRRYLYPPLTTFSLMPTRGTRIGRRSARSGPLRTRYEAASASCFEAGEAPAPWGDAGAFQRSSLGRRVFLRDGTIPLLARPQVAIGLPLLCGRILALLYVIPPHLPAGGAALEDAAAVFGAGAGSLETVFGRSVAASGDGVPCFPGCACGRSGRFGVIVWQLTPSCAQAGARRVSLSRDACGTIR
jgi:hypothetical protein